MSKFDNVLMFLTNEKTAQSTKLKIKALIHKLGYFFIPLPWVLIVIWVLLSHSPFQRPKIGVVNINGIVDEFVKTQAKSGLSYEALRKNVKVFGRALEEVMHDISEKKHIVLLPAEAVISGAKDYTAEVQKLLPKIPVAQLEIIQEQAKEPSSLQQPSAAQSTVQTQLPQDLMLDHLKQKMEQANSQEVSKENAPAIQIQSQATDGPSQPVVQPPLSESKPVLNEIKEPKEAVDK